MLLCKNAEPEKDKPWGGVGFQKEPQVSQSFHHQIRQILGTDRAQMRQACLTGQKGRMKSGKYLSRWTYSTGEVDIQERWAYRRGGHTGEVSIQKRWASKRNRPATELGIKKNYIY